MKELTVFVPARSDLDNIFVDPFGFDFQCLPDLMWREIENGAVRMWKIELPTRRLPETSQFSGRSLEHRYLCARVAAWLRLNRGGFVSATKDLGYQGGLADVASRDRRTFAECGYTKVRKILDGLHADCAMIIASYHFEPLLFQSSRLLHYERWLEELKEELRRTAEKMPIAMRYEDVPK